MNNLRSLSAFLFLLVLQLQLYEISANPIQNDVATEFLILHNNDMHARFEQTNIYSGKCTPADANTDKCYGGFARVAYEVRKYRSEAERGGLPVFYLNAGDTYTGTPWFTVFKHNITAAFLNKLKPDAISLGNHEFDKNVEGLIPFLNEVDFPVLACNLNLTKVPELAATKHLANSTILEIQGVKIGVIGYLTPDTKKLTFKNDVEFNEEITCINAEAANMKKQGINIIIALGHSGYQKDQEIAKNCPEVDIVIGGHTNTFLFNGKQPDMERIDGPYPTPIVQKSGKIVPVVQAYAYTKYLGKFHVKFDADGNLLEFDGTPILLNASVAQEQDLLDLLDVYRTNITALDTQTVGRTKVELQGNSEICRSQECNLGNLIADSMIFARVLENTGGKYWTDAAIALIQGGGIRSSIKKQLDGHITGADILTTLPFENDLFVTQIRGSTLWNTFEHSASVRGTDSNGGFLQVSGVRVVYNMARPKGHRVISVQVRCAACEVPYYTNLNETALYNVIVPQFLLEGGDALVLAEKIPVTMRMQKNDQEALTQYLENRQFVYPGVEGRITYRNSATNIVISGFLVICTFMGTRIFN